METLPEWSETIRLTGGLREESLSPVVRDGLLAAFRNWSPR